MKTRTITFTVRLVLEYEDDVDIEEWADDALEHDFTSTDPKVRIVEEESTGYAIGDPEDDS